LNGGGAAAAVPPTDLRQQL